MKKCDYFKDLILTDYIDKELDKASVGSIESHLSDCSDCRAFLKEVKINAAAPFEQTARQTPPAELWVTVKQSIENGATNPLEGFLDRLKGLIVFPRLVPVFASLMLMLLVGSVTVNTIQIKEAKDKDQGEYLVSLLGSSAQADNNDLGTPIEHYFL